MAIKDVVESLGVGDGECIADDGDVGEAVEFDNIDRGRSCHVAPSQSLLCAVAMQADKPLCGVDGVERYDTFAGIQLADFVRQSEIIECASPRYGIDSAVE